MTAFKGYQLVKGLPEFHFTADGIDVHELITAGDKPHSLVFKFQLLTDLPVFIHVDPPARRPGGARVLGLSIRAP
jgi:hypothetical protein